MVLAEQLHVIFKQFISNSVSGDLLKLIKYSIKPTDVEILMRMIISLKDPSAYCKNDDDHETVSGFFLFIDFVSALLINLGDSVIQELNSYRNTKHPFIPWVIKYVSDKRFHDEIMSKFSEIFADDLADKA